MQRIIKQSKALLLLLAFVLVFSPLSALADAGKSKTINYVALGDSLAKGTLNTGGHSGGYVGNIVNDLESRGYDVNLTNKGENSFTTVDVLGGLAEATAEIASADLITISVGANDVLADLIELIRSNPQLLASFNAEYMTLEGIGKLQQVAAATEATAIVAEENAASAQSLSLEKIGAAKIASNDVVTTAGVILEPLKSYFENTLDPIIWSLIKEEIERLEEAIENMADAMAVEDKLIGAEVLESVTTELNTALGIIESAEKMFTLPDPFNGDVSTFKGKIFDAIDNVDFAKKGVEDANISAGIALQARKKADDAQVLLDNVSVLGQAFAGIPSKVETVGKNIGSILRTIKGINSKAEIYVMGYYNAIPYADSNVVAPLLAGLNEAIMTPTDLFGATFIPTADLFESENYLLPNPTNIHPNEVGYAAIAVAFIGPISSAFPGYTEPGTPSEKEINLGEKVNVSAGEQILINGTDVSLLLPKDLPEGTRLTVSPTSDEALAKAKEDGLEEVGDVLSFTFEFSEGFEDYEGTFTLVMGYDADSSGNVDIYHFEDGKWASKNGEVDKESHEISLEVKSFSDYGVFAKEEIKEEPPTTEEPTDDDKTPPVTKDPTKGTDKDSKNTGKKPTTTTNGTKLPKTATNNYTLLLLGTILLVSGSASLIYMRKKHLVTNEH